MEADSTSTAWTRFELSHYSHHQRTNFAGVLGLQRPVGYEDGKSCSASRWAVVWTGFSLLLLWSGDASSVLSHVSTANQWLTIYERVFTWNKGPLYRSTVLETIRVISSWLDLAPVGFPKSSRRHSMLMRINLTVAGSSMPYEIRGFKTDFKW